jgi:hypothetical protein
MGRRIGRIFGYTHPPRRFAEQRGISKPELLRALGMLKDFQRQAQGHFNANVFAPPGPGTLR